MVKKFKNKFVIIYAKTRDETEKIAKYLSMRKIIALSYHAGLSKDIRNK